MRSNRVFLSILLNAAIIGSAVELFAAQAPAKAPAARARQQSLQSPEVQADRRVTFRLQAPKATEVVVNGQWPDRERAMTKAPTTCGASRSARSSRASGNTASRWMGSR